MDGYKLDCTIISWGWADRNEKRVDEVKVVEFLEGRANEIDAKTDRDDFIENFDKYAKNEEKRKQLAEYFAKRKEMHQLQIKVERLQNMNFEN